jgi:hypothetical protein
MISLTLDKIVTMTFESWIRLPKVSIPKKTSAPRKKTQSSNEIAVIKTFSQNQFLRYFKKIIIP